jgi:hypothetical protein
MSDELEDIEAEEESYAPETLSWPEGQVYFYPDVATFCCEHDSKAVMVTAGGVFLLPETGGKWYSVEDYGKKAKPPAKLASVH